MFRKRHTPVGAKPGTLMINTHAARPSIRVMKYKPEHLEEHDVAAVAELKNLLRIEVGETTSDRMFSLDVGRCFGACGLAPVIMIDDDVHQRVKTSRLAKILDQYRETPAAIDNGERDA